MPFTASILALGAIPLALFHYILFALSRELRRYRHGCSAACSIRKIYHPPMEQLRRYPSTLRLVHSGTLPPGDDARQPRQPLPRLVSPMEETRATQA